jgi:hypothetical protein
MKGKIHLIYNYESFWWGIELGNGVVVSGPPHQTEEDARASALKWAKKLGVEVVT